MDIKKAKKLLNWKPTYNIKDSVRVTTEWYFKVLEKKESPVETTNSQIDNYMYENNWN